jgi:hypothetical protein
MGELDEDVIILRAYERLGLDRQKLFARFQEMATEELDVKKVFLEAGTYAGKKLRGPEACQVAVDKVVVFFAGMEPALLSSLMDHGLSLKNMANAGFYDKTLKGRVETLGGLACLDLAAWGKEDIKKLLTMNMWGLTSVRTIVATRAIIYETRKLRKKALAPKRPSSPGLT